MVTDPAGSSAVSRHKCWGSRHCCLPHVPKRAQALFQCDVIITVFCEVKSCSLWLQGCDSVTHTGRIIESRFGQSRYLPNPSQSIVHDSLPTDVWFSRNDTNFTYFMMLRLLSARERPRIAVLIPTTQWYQLHFWPNKSRVCVNGKFRVQSGGFMCRKGKINSSEMATHTVIAIDCDNRLFHCHHSDSSFTMTL